MSTPDEPDYNPAFMYDDQLYPDPFFDEPEPAEPDTDSSDDKLDD